MGSPNDQSETNWDESDGASASSDECSSSQESNTTAERTVASTADNIAKKENDAFNLSKLLVYVVLLLAATGVGLTTYFVTSGSEEHGFENQVRHLWLIFFRSVYPGKC
jgi:hypothetical protein